MGTLELGRESNPLEGDDLCPGPAPEAADAVESPRHEPV